MAKSNSFNKREIEKKKQSKRQEKQQKKDARKASGVSSLDDMIAYVDENGMITDTPPDLTKKEEIDIENIVISTPKKEELDEPAELKGRVEYFDTSRGYGFIKNIDNTDKYFFHMSSLQEEVAEGDIVYYELIKGIKGLNAINIRIVK